MLYIILALIMFGLLIAVHEFGHFARPNSSAFRSTSSPSAWDPPC